MLLLLLDAVVRAYPELEFNFPVDLICENNKDRLCFMCFISFPNSYLLEFALLV